MKKLLFAALITLSTSLLTICEAQYTILHNFNGTNGSQPLGNLTLCRNLFYGFTGMGGAYGDGCIFSIDTNGNSFKDLFDFNGVNGEEPWGTLIILGNKLYGMAEFGGANNYGVIFSIDTNGGGYKDLLDFNGTNGELPNHSILTSSRGLLYGMAQKGGFYGHGCIFSIDTSGRGYRDRFDFNGVNGAAPEGSLILSGQTLYGTTTYGGVNDSGCVFSIDTSGYGYKDLLDFNNTGNPKGGYPWGTSLTLLRGTLFGMTRYGGTYGKGCMYSIDTSGSGYKDIFDFNGANGGEPIGDLIISGNLFYGMTAYYGANNYGVIFSIDTNGTGYKDLFDFNNINGATPGGDLEILRGTLFGMTNVGGANNDGVIFTFDTISMPLSINEFTQASGGVTLFPNPNSGQFTIELQGVRDKEQVEIYNMLGEKIYDGKLNTTTTQLDLSNNASGIYLFRVLTETGGLVSEGKFVIQK